MLTFLREDGKVIALDLDPGGDARPPPPVVSGITIDTHSWEFYPVCQPADSCSL